MVWIMERKSVVHPTSLWNLMLSSRGNRKWRLVDLNQVSRWRNIRIMTKVAVKFRHWPLPRAMESAAVPWGLTVISISIESNQSKLMTGESANLSLEMAQCGYWSCNSLTCQLAYYNVCGASRYSITVHVLTHSCSVISFVSMSLGGIAGNFRGELIIFQHTVLWKGLICNITWLACCQWRMHSRLRSNTRSVSYMCTAQCHVVTVRRMVWKTFLNLLGYCQDWGYKV